MKIPASIRDLYNAQAQSNAILRDAALSLLKPRLREYWHFQERIKTEESFAIKIESGRFDDPGKLEDFFACTSCS